MFCEIIAVAAELVMMTEPPRLPATICGTVALQVFQTPVKLMPMDVGQVSSVIARGEVGFRGQRVGNCRDGGAGVKRDNARTLLRQGQGVTAALASRSPGDDRDLV